MKKLPWRHLASFAFACLSLQAQPFVPAQTRLEIVSNPVAPHSPVRVSISSSAGFDLADLEVSSDSPWVSGAVLVSQSALELTFATQGLVARTSSATLTLSGGGHESRIAVESTTSLLSLSAMQPDPLRPLVYALQQDGANTGGLLIFDPVAETGAGLITVGRKPTDLAISPNGREAIVLSSASQQIHVIDLVARRVVEVISLPTYTEWGIESSGGRLCYGPGDLIYYSDGAWESNLHAYNRATGTVVQSKPTGVGDFAMLPDASALVGWYRYGWTAGSSNSGIWRIPLNSNGTMGEKAQPTTGPTMNRDPLDTPVLVSPDGAILTAKQYAFRPTDFPAPAKAFAGPVYAISTYGEVVATASGLYDFNTGNQLISLSTNSQVQAITSDYTRLVYFDANQREVQVIAIIDQLMNVDFGGGSLFPADNAAVIPPDELRWSALPGVTSYQVYLGKDEGTVAAATPEDAVYLGTVTSPLVTLGQRLDTNTTYHWRVDMVAGTEVIKGVVRSFFVSSVAPELRRLEATTVQAHRNLMIEINLEGEEPDLPWSAAANVDWVSFVATSGVTPATLQVMMDASALTAGVHGAQITLTHDDGSVVLPVVLTVDALKLTHIKSDPESAIAYAISEDDSQSVPRAHLLEIDTLTETIVRSIPVGSSVTDFAIHLPEDRIYVTNWRPGVIVAVDRESFQTVRTYGFKPWSSVGYGDGDPYRVSAGGFGRIVVEEYDQWIDVRLIDTQTGETLATAFEREGGGVTTAGGRYYYHGDNNISNASLHRFDLLGDRFTELSDQRVAELGYYGSRTVVASEDGKRLFWNGGVFSSNLTVDWSTPEVIYSTNADGSLAFGKTRIFDVVNRSVAFAMPVETTISGFNSTSGKLVVQQGDRIVFYNLNAGVPLVAPVLRATAVGSTQITLEWSDDSLETSLTLQYRLAGDETWIVLTTLSGNTVNHTANGLAPETNYEFRVRANTNEDASAWSNVVAVSTRPAPPSRPSIIEVTRNTDNLVQLHWSEGGPVDSVTIERREGGSSNWAAIATLNAPTGGVFIDPEAKQPDASYFYRIQSFRAGTASPYSSERQIYFPVLSAPTGGFLSSVATANEGALFVRSVSVSGNPFPAIRWYHNDVLLSGQTTAELRIPNLDVLHAGRYRYELSNAQGTFVSNTMELTVVPSPNPIVGTHGYLRHGYEPGGTVRIRGVIQYVGAVSSLGWQVLLPDGWSFVSGENNDDASIKPEAGQTGYLEWAWIEPPPPGSSFTFTLQSAENSLGPQEFAGLILGTKNNVSLMALLQPDPLVVPQAPWHHRGDTNRDGRFSLGELLRIIELYNTRHGTTRTGRYQTSETTSDRYATAPDTSNDVTVDLPDFHSADVDNDARISLAELLRVIELYNTRSGTTRTGAYHAREGTVDGFSPGDS